MREKLLSFLLGAAAAGGASLLFLWRPGATPDSAAAAPDPGRAEIAQQLQQIDRRLAAIEAHNGQGNLATSAAASVLPAAAGVSVPNTEQQRASETGSGIVHQAIAAGVWNRRNAAEFMAAAGSMRGEDRFELIRQLSAAVNEDRVKLEPGAELH